MIPTQKSKKSDIIFEFIARFFAEVIGQYFFGGILWVIRTIGLLWLLLFAFGGKSFTELREKYRGEPVPYFFGFGTVIGIICLVIWI